MEHVNQLCDKNLRAWSVNPRGTFRPNNNGALNS